MGWSEKYKKSIDCDNPKGFSQRADCQNKKKKMSEEKKDHEYSMARSELKTVINATKRLQKKMGKKGEGNLQAWVQSKITKAADYIDTAADYVTNEGTDGIKAKDYKNRLDKWFDDGGWVQTGGKYDGKPCAKQPGQTTKPYCRDPDDRAAMSKDERDKRAAKKRREDPNPNRTGKAKIVTQEETKKDACYKKVKASAKVWPSAYASGRLVQCRKAGASNWGNKSEEWVAQTAAEYLFNEGLNEDGLQIFIEELGLESFIKFVYDLAEDVDLQEERAAKRYKYKPGETKETRIAAARKKAGLPVEKSTKSALNTAKENQPEKKPVKSTLAKSVADTLARGALSAWQGHKAAMRKKKEGASVASQIGAGLGAATGAMLKKGKKHLSDDYQYSDWREDFKAMEYEFIDLIKPEPLVVEGHPMYDPERTKKATSLPAINPEQNPRKNKTNLSISRSADAGEPNAASILRRRTGGASLPKINKEEVESIDELKCWKGYKRKKGSVPGEKGSCVKENEEVIEAKHTLTKSDLEVNIGGGNLQKLAKKAAKRIDYDVDGDVDPNDKVEKKTGEYGEELPTPFGKFRTGDSNKVKVKKEEFSDWRSEIDEGWKSALLGAGLATAVAAQGAGIKNTKKPQPQSSTVQSVSTKQKENSAMNQWRAAHPKLAQKVDNPTPFKPKKLSPINPEWAKAHPELAKKERERREERGSN